MVYVPAAVPAGTEKTALAEPDETAPEVTAVPIVVAPCVTVNVTVPPFTVPAPLVIVAESATFWAAALKVTEAALAVATVEAVVMVKVCVLSLLASRLVVPL